MAQISLSDPVMALAAVVRAGLGGTAASAPIDGELAKFAIRRHRVGPLVHATILAGRASAGADAAASLAANWDFNEKRCRNSMLTMTRTVKVLTEAGVPSVVVKGIPLAQQLYPDMRWRHCGDTDVLVPEDMLHAAATALRQARFEIDDPVFALPGPLQRFALRRVRDVHIRDRALEQTLELHGRLMFSHTINTILLRDDASLQPRLTPKAISVPQIGPGLALFLLHHGASSGWTRLKWLADMLPLLAKLDDPARDRLAGLAERSGTAAAMKASLLLARAAFGAFDLGPLQAWLDEAAGSQAVRRRATSYAGWLNAPSDTTPNPLHSRGAALKCTLLQDDSLIRQLTLLPSAALGSGLHLLGRAAAGLRKPARPATAPTA